MDPAPVLPKHRAFPRTVDGWSMEIRIRRVRRTWLERLFLWERAYEARLHRGQEEIIERGKTPEAAQAFLIKRCFAENGPAITNTEIQIERDASPAPGTGLLGPEAGG